MNSEKYVIYYDETATSRKYVYNIYRTSVSESKDIGDAIEFEDKDTAIKVRDYLNKREKRNDFNVVCMKTTIEEVE